MLHISAQSYGQLEYLHSLYTPTGWMNSGMRIFLLDVWSSAGLRYRSSIFIKSVYWSWKCCNIFIPFSFLFRAWKKSNIGLAVSKIFLKTLKDIQPFTFLQGLCFFVIVKHLQKYYVSKVSSNFKLLEKSFILNYEIGTKWGRGIWH